MAVIQRRDGGGVHQGGGTGGGEMWPAICIYIYRLFLSSLMESANLVLPLEVRKGYRRVVFH